MNKCLVPLLILCLPSLIFAQAYKVHNYSEENGLILGRVNDIAQDADGYMWFKTRTSLVIYDSQRWLELKGNAAPPARCEHLRADRHGVIWGAADSLKAPVYFFQGNQWQTLPTDGLNFQDFWPFDFDLVEMENQTVPVVLPEEGGLLFYREKKWHRLGAEDRLSKGRTVASHGFGERLYLAGPDGLSVFDKDGIRSLNHLLPEDKRALIGVKVEGSEKEEKRIWLLSTEWVGYIEGGTFVSLARCPPIVPLSVSGDQSMLPDGCGGLFFGYPLRLFHVRISHPVVRPLGTHTGLGTEGVAALARDRERNIWIGSLHGVSKINSMRFANFDKRQGLRSDEVTAVGPWGEDEVIIGQSSGFSIYDGAAFRHLPFDKPDDVLIRPFYLRRGSDGSLYAPTLNVGLLHIGKDEKIIRMNPPGKQFAEMRDVLLWPDRPPWVALNSGVFSLESGELKPIVGMPTDINIRAMLRTGDGRIIMGSASDGHLIQRDGVWNHLKSRKEAENIVFQLYEDRKGRVFASTAGGLLELKDDRLVSFSPMLRRRSVYFAVEDHMDRLWVGTDNGVFRFAGENARVFTSKNGLLGVECNRGAGFVDKQGRAWLGTDRGVSLYQPDYDFEYNVPTSLTIAAVESDGTSFSAEEPLELDTERNDLTFHFQVVSYIDEEALTFQSWLEGYDKGPLPEYKSPSRTYRYTNLPPGSYRFHIRVRGQSHVWSPVVSSRLIRIQPPFYARFWFLALVLALVAGIAYSIFEYFSSKRYSRFLEQQVMERTIALSKKTDELKGRIRTSKEAEREIQVLNEALEQRVSERTTALESAQRDLVENAHYAGMAEIANSIIHNVGNILNSVSTSGYLIRQTVEESKMASILRANDLLEEHIEDVGTFFADDPRGKQLLLFYLSLGKVFVKERERLTKHANLLMEKIDTIKDVVAQQHNYASGIYQSELMDAREMVDTGIKILENGLMVHGIDIRREYEEVPPVVIQKTKFIHTIVNLLKNAKESIMSENGELRHIVVGISREGDDVFIRVTDTGLGIPENHLHKIFNHGFTTKKEGHGFGLHSCANAIKEMGGLMWAESPGVGLGATFVLKLPVAEKGAAAIKPPPQISG